jgi:hypothetical protein
MQGYTYDELLADRSKRETFFGLYDRLIAELKKHGYMSSAATHKKCRNRLWDELSILD